MSERRYPGVLTVERDRGTAYYVKFRDADGRQVKQLAGYAADGWTPAKAAKLLAERTTDVRREGWRQPKSATLEDFAERFLTEHMPTRSLKRSTELQYRGDLRNHVIPSLGRHKLSELEQRPELLERFVASRLRAGLAPKSVANLLGTLSLVFRLAQRRRLVRANPCELIDPPRVPGHEVAVLDSGEIAALLAAYRELENDADEIEAPRWATVRRIVVVALGTGMRRGELLGLRWRDVDLLEGTIRVERAYVRNEMTTPKSRNSRRTLEAGPVVSAALEEQWQATEHRSDEQPVFAHPQLGTPLDPSKLSRDYLKPALARAGIVRRFRPWHDLRHTALTHDAALHPQAAVQAKAGHAHGSTTERYVNLARVRFPGAAAVTEARMFGEPSDESGTHLVPAADDDPST